VTVSELAGVEKDKGAAVLDVDARAPERRLNLGSFAAGIEDDPIRRDGTEGVGFGGNDGGIDIDGDGIDRAGDCREGGNGGEAFDLGEGGMDGNDAMPVLEEEPDGLVRIALGVVTGAEHDHAFGGGFGIHRVGWQWKVDAKAECGLYIAEMSPLFQQTREAFARAGWLYRPVEGREVLEADFEAHHAKVSLHVQAFPEIGVVSIVSTSSVMVTPPRRMAVSELLMRVNKELTVGNVEMDWDTGAVMFRVSNVFGKSGMEPELLAGLVRMVVAETDRLTPLLGEIERTTEAALRGLNMIHLMRREDLLPDAGGAAV
jgi:hypothetical protein